MADGPTLKQMRGALKRKVTLFLDFLNNLDVNNITQNEICQIECRVAKFEPIIDEFDQIQLEIIQKFPDDPLQEEEEKEFFKNYYKILGESKSIILKFNNVHPVSQTHQVQVTSAPNNIVYSSMLPRLGIHKFNGKYEDWAAWKEVFLAVVDSDKVLDERQKFLHLRDSLESQVLDVIKSIEIIPSNYKVAWDTLIERFENKSLIIHNHLKSIIEYPQINKESSKDLRNFQDSLKSNLKSLKSLGEQVETWDRLILYTCAKKLDQRTRRDWEVFRYEQELPSMNDFNKFLTQKSSMLERMEIHKQNESFENKKPSNFNQNNIKQKNFSYFSREGNKCEFCVGQHGIQNCTKFLMLSTLERIAQIKEKKLCLNCFSSNHISPTCKAPKCGKCFKSHNLLCHIEYANQRQAASNVGIVSAVENTAEKQGTVGGLNQEQGQLEAQHGALKDQVVENDTLDIVDKGSALQLSEATTAVLKVQDNNSPGADDNRGVLLSTAVVNVIVNGKLIPARALLDSGSTSNFIREEFCKKAGIKMQQTNHVVHGIGKNAINLTKQTNIIIQSCIDIYKTKINCLVIPKITDNLPRVSFPKDTFNIPENYELADPTFNISSEIDLLLGSHVFWSVITAGQHRLGIEINTPLLQKTKFGWVIAGNYISLETIDKTVNSSVSCLSINTRIENQIAKFWEIEEVSSKNKILSDAEKYCELNFEATTKRDFDSRFNVTIPFKESLTKLGNSREMTLKRFYSLENKLQKNEDLRRDYVDFMEEYESLGHMTEILQSEQSLNTGYFLPHHAVIKSNSITTKCRVVFDASAKTNQGSGPSLNQVQFTGPALQNDIFAILVNFRQFKYVMCADISKMYRQIWINENQRSFQKVFWRSNPNQPVKLFVLNTVTYGCASAPYLAVRCILQLARDFEFEYPEACKIISTNFYVDDLITGHNCAEKLLKLQNQIYDILASAGFELRKWLCNDISLLHKFKLNDKTPASFLHIGENENNKTLGIYWNAVNDTLQYSICDFDENITEISKRKILSLICQIYDPLGLLGPIIIVAKLIMQELWRLQISWDENVPPHIFNKWLEFQTNLKTINNLKIPRHVCLSDYVNIELHGFADSSIKAYGACIYIRCISQNIISVKLLCSKTRVAPINTVSLPRLELSACVLLANLAKKVKEAFEINFNRQFFWTDSSVTLAWLRGDISTYKTFVANRVSEIRSLTNKADWYHVKTDMNPADLASRGCTPQALLESDLWFQGPKWLKIHESDWPWSKVNFDLNFADMEIPDVKQISTCFIINIQFLEFLPLIQKYSNLNKLINVFAWVLRSVQLLSICRQNLKNFNSNENIKATFSKNLEPQELDNSLLFLIKIVQMQCFETEYKLLSANKPVQNNSKFLKLNPFMHQSVIRVGGRLKNANLDFDRKHQILLPKGHKLTELIIKNEHERLLHCGTQQLIFSVREKFWPLSARSCCKKIINSCIPCFRVKPKGIDYLMGELPPERVQPSFPFQNVGVDYGGPFLIKDKHVTRGSKLIKVYLCIFVCMATKACHLEVVTELTMAAFLNTFRRFIGRRGKPSNVFSDNGKNFVGANAELQSLYDFLNKNSDSIEKSLALERIQWHFIPPRSPNFGGLWEAAIKKAKFHLVRVVQGNLNSMTFEHLSTLLVEIEGILNSRPLSPLSHDPLDLNPLTPAHFLIGRSLTSLPSGGNFVDTPQNRLTKFQQLQGMVQKFWTRWSREYLSELQVRSKWYKPEENLKEGAMVVLVDENTPPYLWKLGRIQKTFSGSDGIVRVVEVLTQTGTFKRGVTKIRPLPIETC